MRPAERHIEAHCEDSPASARCPATANAFLTAHVALGRAGTSRTVRLLGLALGLALCAPALGQDQPRSFSLPEVSPSPTTAPQGPVDIRQGVVIGPRVIEEPAAERETQPRPAPTASASAAAPGPAPATTAAPAPSSPPVSPPDQAPTEGHQAGSPAIDAPPQPVKSESDNRPLADPDDKQAAQSRPPAVGPANDQTIELRVHRPDLLDFLRAYEGWIAAALALVAAIAAALWIAARRRSAVKRLAPPEHAARPARVAADEAREVQRDAGRAPPSAAVGPVTVAPRIDLRIDVISASRSVMTLALDLRLTVSNRSERPVRGLSVLAKLDCARPGEPDGIAVGAGQPLGDIARIGPQQGMTLAGRLELPVADLRLISQGSGWVYIPLVHLTFEGEGVPATLRSFVIGTPSAAASGRLHPLPVAAPLGGIHGLAAQIVHIPESPVVRPSPAPAAA